MKFFYEFPTQPINNLALYVVGTVGDCGDSHKSWQSRPTIYFSLLDLLMGYKLAFKSDSLIEV